MQTARGLLGIAVMSGAAGGWSSPSKREDSKEDRRMSFLHARATSQAAKVDDLCGMGMCRRSGSRPQSIGGVMTRRRVTAVVAALAVTLMVPSSDVWAGKPAHSAPVVTVLNDTALGGLGSGSTIGPDGALYVTNGNDGTLVRIDPTNGSATVVGSGLPPQVIGVGGAMDVAFIGRQAYVLVTRQAPTSAFPTPSWASTA